MEDNPNEILFSSLEMVDAFGQVTPIEFQPFDVDLTVDDVTEIDELYFQNEKQGGGTHFPSSRRKLIAKSTRHGQRSNDNSDQRNTLSVHELSAPPTIIEEAAGKPTELAGPILTGTVLKIKKGEDILSKILSLSEDGAKAVTVLTANGTVSGATLWRPFSFSEPVTYKGTFTIVTLSGLYLPISCTGGFNISLNGEDGVMFGGKIGGPLIAASKTRVVVGTFPYSGP